MKGNTYDFLLAACSFTLIAHGCTSAAESKEYIAYFQNEEKGLIKRFSQNGLEILCAYKTGDYLSCKRKNIENNAQLESDTLDNKYRSNIYCTLDFSIYGQQIENGFLKNEQLHSACLNYLNNYVYKDVSLYTKKDTLLATASIYARQYGITKSSSILIVFSKGKVDLTHGFDIIYQGDKFGIAPVRFSFTADAINNIPELRN